MSIVKQFEHSITKTFKQNAIVTLPKESRSRYHPLILDLHGAGDRGDDLEAVSATLLNQYVTRNPDFECMTVTPQCEVGNLWNPDRLYCLIEAATKSYPVDTNRLYVMGWSMGARGVWDLISQYPNYFAAAVPISGVACYLTAPRISHIPIWAFHGEDDHVVPMESASRMIDAINEHGLGESIANMTVIHHASHNIAGEIYSYQNIYRWLLSQTSAVNHARKEKIKRLHAEKQMLNVGV